MHHGHFWIRVSHGHRPRCCINRPVFAISFYATVISISNTHIKFEAMDPGYKYLQRIKTVPNLINEDPSIVTPKNSSFMDLPWSDLSKLVATHDSKGRRASGASTASSGTDSSSKSTHGVEHEELGNWDSMTGYQDAQHIAYH